MSLGIVIPLKSKVVAKDWLRTCELLERTLRSIENQTCSDYCAVVVGHEPPDRWPSDSIAFHSLDLPLPALAPGGSYHKRQDFDRILDKNQKIARGVQLLSSEPVTHWYYLDADDLLSNRFVEHICQLELNAGAILDGGYTIYEKEQRAIRVSNLSSICGSTSVLPASCFTVPSEISRDGIQAIPWCRFSHSRMLDFFEQQTDITCEVIAQPLVGYVLGHGDNASDEFRIQYLQRIKSWLKPRLAGSRIDKHFSNEFCFAIRATATS